MGPNSSKGAYKRKSEGDLRQRKRHRRPRPCEDGGRDWSCAATSHGTSGAPRSWKRQRTDSPPEAQEEVWPCRYLDFELLTCERIKLYCFKPQLCGDMLWQLREANTLAFSHTIPFTITKGFSLLRPLLRFSPLIIVGIN